MKRTNPIETWIFIFNGMPQLPYTQKLKKNRCILFNAVKLMCDADDVRLQFIARKIAFYTVTVTFACDFSHTFFFSSIGQFSWWEHMDSVCSQYKLMFMSFFSRFLLLLLLLYEWTSYVCNYNVILFGMIYLKTVYRVGWDWFNYSFILSLFKCTY